MKTEIVKDNEGCGYLLAAILRQTIQDYVGVKRLMLQHRTVAHRFGWESRLKSCELFFNDPPIRLWRCRLRSNQTPVR